MEKIQSYLSLVRTLTPVLTDDAMRLANRYDFTILCDVFLCIRIETFHCVQLKHKITIMTHTVAYQEKGAPLQLSCLKRQRGAKKNQTILSQFRSLASNLKKISLGGGISWMFKIAYALQSWA